MKMENLPQAELRPELKHPELLIGLLVPGKFQPRTHFDDTEMAELIASVRENGVIQPILARPIGDGKYEIIAGERRWRAAKEAFGEGGTIPVKVVVCSDEEAETMAIIENTNRADMSPTEEAQAVARMLQRYSGDKAEVAARLGWPESKVERRLALMRCVPEVREALTKRTILLGHAELLATLPAEKQVSSLSKIIEHKLPVAYVKQYIGGVAQSLEKAIFDKTECLNCTFSSSCQSALFSEALNDGYCTNGECYDKKTHAQLEVVKEELAQEYPVIKIVSLGDAVTTIPIVAEGQMAVGAEQAQACRGCQNFGCTVSALPDSIGNIERDVCFDATCNASKVAAYLRELKQSASAAESSKSAKSSNGKVVAAPVKAKTRATVQTPTKVKEYRVKLWREMAKNELLSRPSEALTLLVALGVVGSARHISSAKMGEAYKKLFAAESSLSSYNLRETLETIHANEAAKAKMLDALSASAMADIDEQQLVAVLQFLQADMRKHWSLCAEYLNLLTKSEIEVVADEVGLKTAMGEKFAKFANGKKDAFVKALLEVEGFDYSQAVPAALVYGHKDATPSVMVSAQATATSEGEHDTESDDTEDEDESCPA